MAEGTGDKPADGDSLGQGNSQATTDSSPEEPFGLSEAFTALTLLFGAVGLLFFVADILLPLPPLWSGYAHLLGVLGIFGALFLFGLTLIVIFIEMARQTAVRKRTLGVAACNTAMDTTSGDTSHTADTSEDTSPTMAAAGILVIIAILATIGYFTSSYVSGVASDLYNGPTTVYATYIDDHRYYIKLLGISYDADMDIYQGNPNNSLDAPHHRDSISFGRNSDISLVRTLKHVKINYFPYTKRFAGFPTR